MLDTFRHLLTALGSTPQPMKDGAVGLGSATVPGAARIVPRLLEYAQKNQRIEVNELGPATVDSLTVNPAGRIRRFQITGTVNDDPWSYSPRVPESLLDLACGREAQFGPLTVQGILQLPELSMQGDTLMLMFASPFMLRKSVDAHAGFIRRKFSEFLQTNLLGIKITAESGTPILSNAANWIAPTLLWG